MDKAYSTPSMELEVEVNGTKLTGKPKLNVGDQLVASISDEIYAKQGGFYVIQTPLAEFVPDYEAIKARHGEVVDLGKIPTLTHHAVKRADFTLEEGMLHDLFYLYNCTKLDTFRLTAGEEPEYRLTFDAIMLMIALRTGFKPQELEGVKATVICDEYNLRNRNEYLHYGFQVGHIVANVSTQGIFNMFFTQNTGDLEKDFWTMVKEKDLATLLAEQEYLQ